MNRVFLNQTRLKIKIVTETDISDASEVFIMYQKPDRVFGEFTAVVENTPRGIISYDVMAGDINVVGTWRLWPKIIFTDLTAIEGSAANMNVSTPGSL